MSGIILQRAGGLSSVKQANDRAPEKKGVWAFIWPFYELFLLGSTGPEGKTSGEDSRFCQLQREGWRKWEHEGKIWTRIEVPGSPIYKNGWFLTTGYELDKHMSKYFSQVLRDYRRYSKKTKEKFDEEFDPADMFPAGANPYGTVYSCDEFEVFVSETPN